MRTLERKIQRLLKEDADGDFEDSCTGLLTLDVAVDLLAVDADIEDGGAEPCTEGVVVSRDFHKGQTGGRASTLKEHDL